MKLKLLLTTLASFLWLTSYTQTVNWSSSDHGTINPIGADQSLTTLGSTFQKRDASGNILMSYDFGSGITVHGADGNTNGEYVVYGFISATTDMDITAGINDLVFDDPFDTPEFFYAKYDASNVLQYVNQVKTPPTVFDGYIRLRDMQIEEDGTVMGVGEVDGKPDNSFQWTPEFYFGNNFSHKITTENPSVFMIKDQALSFIEASSGGFLFSGGMARDPQTGQMSITLNSYGGPTPNYSSTDFVTVDESLTVDMVYGGSGFIYTEGNPYLVEIFPTIDRINWIDDIEYDDNSFLHIIGGIDFEGGGLLLSTGQTINVEFQGGAYDAVYAIIDPIVIQGPTPSSGSVFQFHHSYGSVGDEPITENDWSKAKLVLHNGLAHISREFNDEVTFIPGSTSDIQTTIGNGESTIHTFKIADMWDPTSITLENLFTIGGTHRDYISDFSIDANNDLYVTVGSEPGLSGAIDIDPSPVTHLVPDHAVIKYNGSSSVITGIVYNDINSNGIQDSAEEPVYNAPVIIDNGSYSFTVSTDIDGVYEAHVPIGTYTISCDYANAGYYSGSLPMSINVPITLPNSTHATNDFGLSLIAGMNDVAIFINPLTLVRPGFDVQYEVIVINVGTTVSSPVATFNLDAQLDYTSAEGSPTVSGNSLTWNISSLAIRADTSFIVNAVAQTTIGLGTLVVNNASVEPIAGDQNALDNVASVEQITQGSYDPNDKQVFPSAVSQAFVDNGEYLNYLIRFQNTGTDTAFTVIVRDTLDSFIDYNSLKITSEGHDLTPTMYFDVASGKQIMEFKFSNILLVDSTANEPESHGYLSYRVKLVPGFTAGDIAYNTADIYFDYNLPVITNTTETQISLIEIAGLPTDATCIGECNGSLTATPTGGSGNYTFLWQGSTETSATLSQLCAGEYSVQITDDVGNLTTESFVINAPSIPAISSVTGECMITVSPIDYVDGCAGTITPTTTDEITYSVPGTHTINWTYDFGNGHIETLSQTAIVEDNNAPDEPVLAPVISQCSVTLTAPTTTDDCAGTLTGITTDPLVYDVVGNYTVTWNFDDGNGNITSTQQTISVEDNNAPDQPTLAPITSECSVTLVPPTTTDACAGTITGTTTDPLVYNVTGNYIVSWVFNDGNGNITVTQQTVDMTEIISTVTVVNDLTLAADASGYNYQWINCDSGDPVDLATFQTFEAVENGNYAVEIDNGECIVTSECFAITTVGVDENTITGLQLYPNPAQNEVTIILAEPVNLTLTDLNGKVLFTENNASGEFKIDLSYLNTGVYFMNVHDIKNSATYKIIKE